jgi:hypothetical protein
MITIFANFRGKKLAFFSITNVMINFLQKLAIVRAKNAKFFAKTFYVQILTPVPVPQVFAMTLRHAPME